MHWSKGRHVSYSKCPRQFFYRHVAAPQNRRLAELADRESPYLLRHNIVRDVVLGLVESRASTEPIDMSAFLVRASDLLATMISEPTEVTGQLTIIEQCLDAFVRLELPDIQRSRVVHVSSGEPAEFSYDGLAIMAAPEVVLDRGPGLEIVSYLTGQSNFRKADEAFLRAGGLTAWARSVLKEFRRPVQVTEVYLREDCLRVELSLKDDAMRSFLADAKETAIRYSSSAKIRDFPACPDASGCRFCDFKAVCPEYQEFAEVDYGLAALRAAAGKREVMREGPGTDTRDVFLCHVGREKESTVRPLARALEAAGITYWLDEAEILLGDGIVKMVNQGLKTSRYVLCFMSEGFIGHGWPEAEMESALSGELAGGGQRVLPVIIGEAKTILDEYPLLKGKRYSKWDEGPAHLVHEIERVLTREAEMRRREGKK